MDKKVKYGTEEYRKAYNEGRVVNNYNKGTYEITLPDIVITPRNNLNLGSVVRNGTSNIANSIYKVADSVIDYTPLAPAKTVAKLATIKQNVGKEVLGAMVDLLPYFNYKMITTPIKETDKLYKTISNNRGIHRISLSTPKKGEVASIELSPSEYNDFGKRWLHPEYIRVKDSEQGKGLSNVLYDEGIKFAQKRGYNGILSGEALLQPAKTIKTQKRFNGPEMKNPAEDYTIKGMESPKDSKMSKKIISKYNKDNEVAKSLGQEIYNAIIQIKPTL